MTVLKLDTDSVQALREAVQNVFVQHDAPLPDAAYVSVTVSLSDKRELFDALIAGTETRDYVDVAKPFRAATITGYASGCRASITVLAQLTDQEALAAFARKHHVQESE